MAEPIQRRDCRQRYRAAAAVVSNTTPASAGLQTCSGSLLPQVPDDSLTVFDKGFLAAEILCGLTMNGRNRHFLIPAKSNTRWDVIAGTAEDATVRMRVSAPGRKKCSALPEFWQARAIRVIDVRGRERVLLTSPAFAKLPACLQRLRERLKALPIEKRPGRACDRVVKSRPQRYTVRYLKKDLN